MTNNINAPLLINMIISGANNLSNNRDYVDSLNVFPVPDGDTGTNMSLTFINASRSVENTDLNRVCDVLDAVSKATLRGARGNSGVILSQIFRGFAKAVTDCETLDVPTIKKMLRGGSDTAYRAVMKPTEGTILTVIRSIAEAGEECEKEDITEFFTFVMEKAHAALKSTQQMLPQLKQAGVVDAGGQGLTFIFDGFLSAIKGEVITLEGPSPAPSNAPAQQSIKTEEIKFTYCTEFIINKYSAKATAAKLRASIETKGDCMIVIDDEDIVKVHIHTNHPGFVLEQAVKLGELINIKIENMKEQHTQIIEEAPKKEKEPQKEIAFVAVCNGDGLEKTFLELGVNKIISGGQTMNPSTEDILKVVEEVNAKNVFILPNNKNIILAAQQVTDIAECNVIVLETKTIPEGISAMMASSSDASVEENTKKMTKAIGKVSSGNVTYAVKDTSLDGKAISKGDIIGVSGGKILSVDKDINASTLSLINEIADEDSEIITLYYGEGIKESEAVSLSEKIESSFPDADVYLVHGGQSVYYYIISVE